MPRINDGYMVFFPLNPQTEDPITRVPGQSHVMQGYITDEAGRPLSGICIKLDHRGFNQDQTGADGMYRLIGNPTLDDIPPLGVRLDIWDCVPGGAPDWVGGGTYRPTLTQGDVSTWHWRLLPASKLLARIVDGSTGQPLSGMCVTGQSFTGHGYVTIRSRPSDATGAVTLHGVAPWDGEVEVVSCGRTGYDTLRAMLPFRPGSTVTHTFEIDLL